MLALALALMFAGAAPPDATVSPLEVLKPAAKAPPADATVQVQGTDDDIDTRFIFWPATAYQARFDGHVRLRCLVDAHGIAERCEVASETPAGKGFGRAALQVRPTLKLKPHEGPDGPTSAVMNIAVTFTAPDTWQDHDIVRGNPKQMTPIPLLDYPVWSAAPSFDDLAAAYPEKAGGAEGYAVLNCKVVRSGAVEQCGVIKEDPENRGFGKAAMSLAPRFRVEPRLAATRLRTALAVDIPVRFPSRQDLAERTVTAPAWISGFDARHMPKVFPPEAANSGVTSGRGVARCVVGADGALTACQPETGDPEGLGFSEAAAKLASAMKMNLWSADAEPVEGGVIHVPIRLNLKPGAD